MRFASLLVFFGLLAFAAPAQAQIFLVSVTGEITSGTGIYS